MTFSKPDKQGCHEIQEYIVSPFQDEAIFPEEETIHAADVLESRRLAGYEDESPFLQAFVEKRAFDAPIDDEAAAPAFAEDEGLAAEFEAGEDWEATAPWQPEYEPEMDTEADVAETREAIDEVDEYGEEEFFAEEKAGDWQSAEDGEVDWEEGEGSDEGAAIEATPSLQAYQLPCDDLERIPTDYEGEFEEFFDEESGIKPDDKRIDVRAKLALPKMLKRPDMQADAQRLIAGINSGQLAGIYGNDYGIAVKVAATHNRNRFQLIPKGEDGSLVLSDSDPVNAPPTVFFRGDDPDISKQPQRFYTALQKASQTFKLCQEKQIGRCVGDSLDLIKNLIPEDFCRIYRSDLVVKVIAKVKSVNGATAQVVRPMNEAVVSIIGPLPRLKTKRQQPTNAQGIARFADLLHGLYQITGSKVGYHPYSTTVYHPTGEKQVYPGTVESSLNVELPVSDPAKWDDIYVSPAPEPQVIELPLQNILSPGPILVLYWGFYKNPEAVVDFKLRAERLKQSIEMRKCAEKFARRNRPFCKRAYIYQSGVDILNSINDTYNEHSDAISAIYVYGHGLPIGLTGAVWGTRAGLYVDYADGKLTSPDITEGGSTVKALVSYKHYLSNDIKVFLLACHTAEDCPRRSDMCSFGAGVSFAESLADTLVFECRLSNAKVYGYKGSDNFAKNRDWWVFFKDPSKKRGIKSQRYPGRINNPC